MMLNCLENNLNIELQQLSRLGKEMELLGDGKLHIRNNDGKIFFREYNNGVQRGITKDKERIYRLARKDFVNEKIKDTAKKIRALEELLKKLNDIDTESKTDKLLERYSMLDSNKLALSEDELKIYNNRFSHNPFNKDGLIYKTEDGVSMRSKSERFIGSFLENEGLLYMYEPEIIIGGRNMYPDFVILRPDGKRVIWEHCGLINDMDYYNKMIKRLDEYRKIGYVQHKNLICTYEEDLQNIDNLREIVRRFVYS